MPRKSKKLKKSKSSSKIEDYDELLRGDFLGSDAIDKEIEHEQKILAENKKIRKLIEGETTPKKNEILYIAETPDRVEYTSQEKGVMEGPLMSVTKREEYDELLGETSPVIIDYKESKKRTPFLFGKNPKKLKWERKFEDEEDIDKSEDSEQKGGRHTRKHKRKYSSNRHHKRHATHKKPKKTSRKHKK